MELTELTVFVRLVLAAAAGGILGLERTRKKRAAGLRTYMLVCIGSAVVAMTSLFIRDMYGGTDPARLSAQVISGIGFIGAGSIIMTGYHKVKGLTTAAGLWAAACMGIAVGFGFYSGALIMFVIILFALFFGERLQDRYESGTRRMRAFVMFGSQEVIRPFLRFVHEKGIEIDDIDEILGGSGLRLGMIFMFKFREKVSHKDALKMLGSCEGVDFIEEL
jgi:putative Mg2+ transporter-C (MgtC) family protein